MRILQVRFENLNSLAGEWHIDFSHPTFASDGIFAITGPTGAGKTTILDAVCLALYGRTPRLNKITKNANEIMARRTGQCFAEVTFETQAGRFRCHWSQHRARKKPGGELQPPRHEIADADSGRILESKLSGVAQQIESAIGMDFDRFTRSMLLAQGGFATFLQAAADERAPILEQITGTDIYSRISICVHERRSTEQKRLEQLSAELNIMQVLAAEDERQLQITMAQYQHQGAELTRQAQQLNQALAWLDRMSGLEEELKNLTARRQDWQARREAFAPERQRLHRAARALELAGEHAALSALHDQQQADIRNLEACRQDQPSREAAVKDAETKWRSADANLQSKKDGQKQALLVIRRVRELDLRIAEKNSQLRIAADALAELDSTLADLRARHAEGGVDLGARRRALATLTTYFTDLRLDEGLVEHLAGIRGRCEVFQDRSERLRARMEALAAAETDSNHAATHYKEKTAGLDTCRQEYQDLQRLFEQKRIARQNILAERDFGGWRSALAQLAEQKNLLAKIAEALRTSSHTQEALARLETRRETLGAQKPLLEQHLQAQVDRTRALEREGQLLETQLVLLKKIENFETARRDLSDGEPCPLCGAREHPFADGNVPVPDPTTTDLRRVKTDLKSANAHLSDLKVKQAETLKDLSQIGDRQNELSATLSIAEAAIVQDLANLSPAVTRSDLEECLPYRQKENQEAIDRLAERIQAAEALAGELEKLGQSFEKVKNAALNAEREAQTADHIRLSTAQAVVRVKTEAAALEAERRAVETDLLQEISPYGIRDISLDSLEAIQTQLTTRRSRWLERQVAKVQHEQAIAALAIQIGHLEEQIARSAVERQKQRERLAALRQEHVLWVHERQGLFGEKYPDDEESRLAAAVETASDELDTTRRALEGAHREAATQRSRVEALETSIAGRAGPLQKAREAFTARLGNFGFNDEADYQSAGLTEEERTRLNLQERHLTDEQTALDAAQKEKAIQLQTERQKRLTDQPHETLAETLAGVLDHQKDIQQAIGGIQRKLMDNDSLKQKQQERIQIMTLQKSECRRWDLLHELIGSADGKKYRNFAQGLTFEIMIGHANRQLCKMTDRYLLIRDASLPLELNVIDNYQASEIRSTKNLSGGESFIVSLALALGLSQMVGRNVRVDSLFLDEGFGTLDDEALDTALETLAGLRQDGKLIGVISHVPALKERIGTRIQVIRQTGGRSVIAGPGCSRL